MATFAATAAAVSISQLPPAITASQLRGWKKLPGPSRAQFNPQFKPFDSSRIKLHMKSSSDRIRSITHATRTQSASSICSAALNATCVATQTRPDTKRAPSITKAPGKETMKPPQIDDRGPNLPPRDGGGGGGGGGGENFSGGFFLFGFLLVLGFLKDLEKEHEYNLGFLKDREKDDEDEEYSRERH